jgi:hypothetical protein
MTKRIPLLIVSLLLLSLPAFAIPNIKNCSSYVVYAIGFVPNSQIAAENFPNPVNANTAEISAGGRCYSLWTSALAYANAGCQVQVQNVGTGYNYQCLKCVGAFGPVIALPPVDIAEAIFSATGVVPGDVLSAQLVQYPAEVLEPGKSEPSSEVVQAYEVDVFDGKQITRVRVDAKTGEATLPPRN